MTEKQILLIWHYNHKEKPILLKKFLRDVKQISRKLLADIKYRGGRLAVNGQEVTVRHVMEPGDVVEVMLPPERISRNIKYSHVLLDICYEDDHVLVINKPAGLMTIPSDDWNERSLAGAVLNHYADTGWPGTFHAVNRLDRDTSGLIVIAKHSYAHSLLAGQQKSGKVERHYAALVTGFLPWQFGSVYAPVARNPASIIERFVSPQGQKAVTHFERQAWNRNYSLVFLRLETGRTHQIRVHMSWLGFPLAGDTLYGGSEWHISRHALHVCKTSFYHPLSAELLHFEVPLPAGFELAADENSE